MTTLPHSLEAEMAVLGAVLCDPRLSSHVFTLAKPADFYAPHHGIIAAALIALDEAGKPIDRFSLVASLRASERLETCGGVSYLSSLMESVQTTQTALYAAGIVAEKATLRRLYAAGADICNRALDGEGDVAGTLADCDALLRDAIGTTARDGIALSDGIAQIYRELDAVVSGETPKALMTPWRVLNQITGGIFPGELAVVAAAPGTGKSAFAMQIVQKAAYEGRQCIVFALEMGPTDTIRRMLASSAGLEVRKLRRGDLRPVDFDRIGESISQLSALPIWFEGSYPRKSVTDIRRICRAKAKEGELGVVLVDHPGYLREALLGSKSATKHERLEYVYQELKLIAEEMQTPVIAVQHLNRAGMDGQPSLAHLRDGGNLEGHAHMVIFPYREDPVANPALGKLYVAKNRDGSTGVIDMQFNGAMFEWIEAAPFRPFAGAA